MSGLPPLPLNPAANGLPPTAILKCFRACAGGIRSPGMPPNKISRMFAGRISRRTIIGRPKATRSSLPREISPGGFPAPQCIIPASRLAAWVGRKFSYSIFSNNCRRRQNLRHPALQPDSKQIGRAFSPRSFPIQLPRPLAWAGMTAGLRPCFPAPKTRAHTSLGQRPRNRRPHSDEG